MTYVRGRVASAFLASSSCCAAKPQKRKSGEGPKGFRFSCNPCGFSIWPETITVSGRCRCKFSTSPRVNDSISSGAGTSSVCAAPVLESKNNKRGTEPMAAAGAGEGQSDLGDDGNLLSEPQARIRWQLTMEIRSRRRWWGAAVCVSLGGGLRTLLSRRKTVRRSLPPGCGGDMDDHQPGNAQTSSSPPRLLASLPPRLLLWFSRSPPGPASCSFTPQPCLLLLLSALPCLSDARILIQPPKTGWITAQLLRRVTPPELRAVHSGLTCGVAPGPKILPWSGSYPPGTCFCCHGGGNVRGGGSGGGSSWNNASSKGTWWKGCRRRCGHRSGGGGGDNAAAASSGAGGGAAGQSASVEAPRACQAPRPQKDCAGCPHCPHSVCGRRPVGRHCRYPGGGAR